MTSFPDTHLLRIERLNVAFRTRLGLVRALSDAEVTLDAGESLVVLGESGSGKSVLAQTIMGLLPRNAEVAGSVRLRGRELLALTRSAMREQRRRIAYIPQSPASALNPVRRVGSTLAELARVRGLGPAEARTALERALGQLGLSLAEVGRLYPHQLSGGMQQRFVNSLALVGRPELVIADEPTSGLDPDLVDAMASQLQQMARDGAGVIVISHDLALAERLGGAVALLYAGFIAEARPTAAFFAEPAHPYGVGLLGAMPEHGGVPIPGLPPELTDLPAGCAFAPRCHRRRADCTKAVPEPLPLKAGEGSVRCVLYAEG